MKCDNNSIYELQDQVYGLLGTPWHALYSICWHFSNFENSMQTIIFWFQRFLRKKKLQSQQKLFYTMNTAFVFR